MGQSHQRPRRLLGLDPGQRRIGVALSDELGLFAHPRPAIITGRTDAFAAIARIVQEEDVGEVVVGLPLSLSGDSSAQTDEARAFSSRLRERLSVPVSEWDERLSSVEAARSGAGRGKRNSGELDSAAAAVVLQAVLDSRRGAPA